MCARKSLQYSAIATQYPCFGELCVGTEVEVNRLWLTRAPEEHLIQQLEPIAASLAAGKRVMLYCKRGKNRSPALACLVLAPCFGGDVYAAAAWIHGLRGVC